MAPIKRKTGPTNESFVRSKRSSENGDRPSKRPRQEDSISQKPKLESDTKSSTSFHPIKIAKSKEEEAAFPRGGASILTPLEHKQIQIDATRDVLFEQKAAKGKTQELEEVDITLEQGNSKKRKPKAKGKKTAIKEAEIEDTVKIEGLSYKRLLPGSLVLGKVSQINAHDIALALPNNLTGYVPITSVSEKLTARIEKLAAEEETDGEKSDNEETDDIVLEDMFSMGQYLRAFVVSTSDGNESKPAEKGKRRIELSLQPQQANHGTTSKELVPNSMIMASVISVEDHGLIMDLGLNEGGIKGFMSSKEVGHNIDFAKIKEGTVFLCMITGLSSNGKTIKLSADAQKFANTKKPQYLAEAPSVDAFLPGTAVEVLVTDITSKGLTGKLMGMVDVTADLVHSGAGANGKDLEKKYKIGSRIKARILCTFPLSEPRKLGISLLEHIINLSSTQAHQGGQRLDPLDVLPLSTIVEDITVKKVEPGIGLFVDTGVKGVPGFVHISRVTDGKIETISESSGAFKVDSVHRGRIIGYNSVDGVFLVSLEQKVLDQAFLRIEDLIIGEVVKGKVEKLVINSSGVGGVLVNLADGITGLVPEMHMADVSLLHPEKKFKEGSTVVARVLSTNPSKRQIRLTLKKTLVNSEAIPWKSYKEIYPGMQSPGTIVNVIAAGAVVQFYGTIRGFLPVSEMSEAYIEDPSQHFRVGQVVNVHVLNVDSASGKLTVSCKDPAAFGLVQQNAMKKLKIGEQVSGVVTEKSNDDVSVELAGSSLRALLSVGHLTDGSDAKNASALKKIRVGQTLTDLVILEKSEQKHLITLTNKPTLLKAAKDRTLLREFDDVKENKLVHGFVKNITLTAVFVQFAGGLTGLLPKSKLPESSLHLPDFGLKRMQSMSVRVISVDHEQRRFLLSGRDFELATPVTAEMPVSPGIDEVAVNPVDEAIRSTGDLVLGRLTSARIISIKDTQINVQLADNIQGRIDVSQVFDSWDEIKDRKHPLKYFAPKQILKVQVLGIHDARNHRFLPISHRAGKTLVFELSAKKSDQTATKKTTLTLDKVKAGSSWIAYVNNVGDDCLWVNLSPNVRGRIRSLDVSEDVSLLRDMEVNYPIGSAIRVHVIGVDVSNNRLDLSARSAQKTERLTFNNLSKDMVVPGKVTKVNERQIMVQLSDTVSGPVHLTDLADDFSEANPTLYSKNDIVRVCVTEVDPSTKKLRLSTRPSRVLNSSLLVTDPEISSVSQLHVNDVIRGFVKNVADNGVFINLGGNVTAYVRVSDLSDSYLKDWKSSFQVDQLVKGKVVLADPLLNHVQLSLKSSVIEKDYVAPITFNDLKVGQVVTGKIRKVEDFGVFIVIDNSSNVSGLCHRSEMAETRVEDVKKLYEEGDAVKAIILKVELEKKRISLGLKASYLESGIESADDSDDEDVEGLSGVKLDDSSDEESEEDAQINLAEFSTLATDDEAESEESTDEDMIDAPQQGLAPVLKAGGFDWAASILDDVHQGSGNESDENDAQEQKKKRRKPTIKIDRTGDLDAHGPQSVSDFERLLLGQPDSSRLWIEYMAFQMKLSELAKARDVGERAIRTIGIREETEKMNIWIALLNLESTYGSDETVEEVFKRACQYNDAQEIHERLTSIYIQSTKYSKADELFQVMTKKFSQSPDVWYNYAHFLHQTLSTPDRARALLPRATQSLPKHTHLNMTIKFAALEFHSTNGSPERGRTMFEGLLSTFPKRLDLWNQLLDLEIQQGDQDTTRAVFERVINTKGLKPKGAKSWFKRWSEWEDKNGDTKSKERVRAQAEEWVRSAAEVKTHN